MLELTQQQMKAVETEGPPPVLVNPSTREEFVLVRREVYDRMQKWMAPLKRRWDNPADDDLIRKP